MSRINLGSAELSIKYFYLIVTFKWVLVYIHEEETVSRLKTEENQVLTYTRNVAILCLCYSINKKRSYWPVKDGWNLTSFQR